MKTLLFGLILLLSALLVQAQQPLKSKEELAALLTMALQQNNRSMLEFAYVPSNIMWATTEAISGVAGQAPPSQKEVEAAYPDMKDRSLLTYNELLNIVSRRQLVLPTLRLKGVQYKSMLPATEQLDGGMMKLEWEAEDDQGTTQILVAQVDVLMWAGQWHWVGEFSQPRD
jgi:hypothetical protein